MAATELRQVLDERGEASAEAPKIEPETLLRMYRAMAAARRIDGRCMKLQRQGRIGFYGTCRGEEAAAVGSAAALRDEDWVFPALRQGAVMLYRGWPIERWFDHLFGNARSVEQGRSMPCHYSDRAVNQVSWSSCMATQLPHAVGMAYAARLRGDDVIAAAYMGDGATSEGDFHTALNFAGVWRTPTVFICNNNQWAISVPFERQSGSATVQAKAAAYGMPGVRVDGNDILAVYQAVADASARARAGDGPTLIEAVTFRMDGHSTSDDPTKYRDEALVAEWEKRDPLARFAKYLVVEGVASPDDLEAIHTAVEAEIDAAIKSAEAVGPPPPRSLIEGVYATPPWHLEEQFAEVEHAIEEARR